MSPLSAGDLLFILTQSLLVELLSEANTLSDSRSPGNPSAFRTSPHSELPAALPRFITPLGQAAFYNSTHRDEFMQTFHFWCLNACLSRAVFISRDDVWASVHPWIEEWISCLCQPHAIFPLHSHHLCLLCNIGADSTGCGAAAVPAGSVLGCNDRGHGGRKGFPLVFSFLCCGEAISKQIPQVPCATVAGCPVLLCDGSLQTVSLAPAGWAVSAQGSRGTLPVAGSAEVSKCLPVSAF